jgi:transposase-like protein
MQKRYHRQARSDEGSEIQDALEVYVREGARRMLAAALEEEVSEFLGRGRYERKKEFRGYRNGYHPSRELTVGLSPVEVRVPRVSEVPSGGRFESQIVRRYERASRRTQQLFARLYMEGLSSGDFEPVFRELVGETTALSANAVVRLKEEWSEEYEGFRHRVLSGHRYAYVWADGIYVGAGMEKEKTALLCVLGAREDGVKELLAMEEG